MKGKDTFSKCIFRNVLEKKSRITGKEISDENENIDFSFCFTI